MNSIGEDFLIYAKERHTAIVRQAGFCKNNKDDYYAIMHIICRDQFEMKFGYDPKHEHDLDRMRFIELEWIFIKEHKILQFIAQVATLEDQLKQGHKIIINEVAYTNIDDFVKLISPIAGSDIAGRGYKHCNYFALYNRLMDNKEKLDLLQTLVGTVEVPNMHVRIDEFHRPDALNAGPIIKQFSKDGMNDRVKKIRKCILYGIYKLIYHPSDNDFVKVLNEVTSYKLKANMVNDDVVEKVNFIHGEPNGSFKANENLKDRVFTLRYWSTCAKLETEIKALNFISRIKNNFTKEWNPSIEYTKTFNKFLREKTQLNFIIDRDDLYSTMFKSLLYFTNEQIKQFDALLAEMKIENGMIREEPLNIPLTINLTNQALLRSYGLLIMSIVRTRKYQEMRLDRQTVHGIQVIFDSMRIIRPPTVIEVAKPVVNDVVINKDVILNSNDKEKFLKYLEGVKLYNSISQTVIKSAVNEYLSAHFKRNTPWTGLVFDKNLVVSSLEDISKIVELLSLVKE